MGVVVMLIEFSVANYRSIRDRQSISLAKSKLKEPETLKENCFSDSSLSGVGLLRSCAIYGPNAAGKSNLLFALREMARIVEDSATEMQRGDELPVQPFRLDTAFRLCPAHPTPHPV